MPNTKPTYTFTAKLFRYSAETASWFFVATDTTLAAKIKKNAQVIKGFGSIPVQVTIGQTTWRTSLFPSKDKTYLLAIKAEVRRKEDIREGDRVRLSVVLV